MFREVKCTHTHTHTPAPENKGGAQVSIKPIFKSLNFVGHEGIFNPRSPQAQLNSDTLKKLLRLNQLNKINYEH